MKTRTLKQLSPSKLNCFMQCPIKFHARYILGIKGPPSVAMLLGRCVHEALEFLGRRRQLEIDLTLDDVLGRLHAAWNDELEANEIDAAKAVKIRVDGERMIRTYWDRYANERPVASELRLEEPLVNPATGQELTEMPLVGIVDSLVAEEDGLVIVDFKTTARTSSAVTISLSHRIQMLAYAYMLRRATDQPVKAVEIRQIDNKREPEVTAVRIPLPEQVNYALLFLVIDSLLEALNTDRWMPRYSFLCSAACEGYGKCSGVSGRAAEMEDFD